MKTILCLKGSVEALPIIEKVKAMGHRAVVVDRDPECVSRAIADEFICADHYNAEETLSAVLKAITRLDAVLCCAGDTPHTAAAIAEHFGLPGLAQAQARLSVDKVDQAVRIAEAGINTPDFTCTFYGSVDTPSCKFPLDLNPNDLIAMNSDAVIKPADSRGGRGVIRLKYPLTEQVIFAACAESRRHSVSGKLIGEQWLDGPQLSTESIVQDGKVLFTAVGLRNYDRLDEFSPFVVEDGFEEPCQVNHTFGGFEFMGQGDSTSKISELIENACRALDWYQSGGGTVKGDLVIHNGQLYIIELAARLSGGFFATHGHLFAYGVDFIEKSISLALGERISIEPMSHREYVCQRYVFPKPEDIGKTVKQVVEFYPFDPFGDVFRTWNIKPGDIIQPVTYHNQRWGQALATGNTPQEAREKAERAVREMYSGVVLE